MNEMRREMLGSQERKWRLEVRRLKALLHNAEARTQYYQGQLDALRSVPMMEAAE